MAAKEKAEVIQARINSENKSLIVQAAKLREIPVSDYMRLVLIDQARKEVTSNDQQVLQLTADEQIEFWNALDKPKGLTKAQKELGKLIKGE